MNNKNQYPLFVALKIIHYLDDDEIVKKEKVILKDTARLSKQKASEILDERNIKHDHIVFVENTNTRVYVPSEILETYLEENQEVENGK